MFKQGLIFENNKGLCFVVTGFFPPFLHVFNGKSHITLDLTNDKDKHALSWNISVKPKPWAKEFVRKHTPSAFSCIRCGVSDLQARSAYLASTFIAQFCCRNCSKIFTVKITVTELENRLKDSGFKTLKHYLDSLYVYKLSTTELKS